MADDDWAPASASALAEATGTGPKPTPAVEVPGFTDLREVARGGDSIVYRARQRRVDRDVAIKVIQISDPADAARFRRELEITVRLGRQHPHIVTVLDTTTTTTGEPCLVMEFHDLGSLHDRLRETGPLPVSDVVTAGTAVADALAFAHSHGVLHRDVKPQNVLVLPTSYVLSDFGIARMADAGHTATLERFSYRHASPQVLDGLPPTEADDVWSLGSTLFTLLDGRAPFASLDPDEDTALAYLRRVRTDQRRTLDRDDVPDELRALIDDCLVPDRDEQVSAAREALRRLRRIRTEDRSWQPSPGGGVEADVATRERLELPDGDPSLPEAGSGGAVVAEAVPAVPAVPAEGEEDVWAPGAVAAVTTTGRDARDPSELPPSGTSEEPDEPVQVAPSVLAHVATRPAPAEEPDGEHTGLAPVEEDPAERRRDRDEGPGDEDDESSGRGGAWRRVAAFIGGAVLVGAAIGVGSAVLQGMGGDDPTVPPTTQDSGIPTHTGELPTDDPLDVQVVDSALSPRQLVIDRDHGTSVELSWTAPEQDVDLYVIVSVDGADDPSNPVVLGETAPPFTEIIIEGRDPDGEECFAVVGVVAGEREAGISNVDCR